MIENTGARDPFVHLIGAMSDGTEKYITDMEAAGQRQLVNSTDLPTDMQNSQADFEALGFTFGEPYSHDPMFRPATLPEGWRRESSDHAMWSHIVDDLGRKRVAVFYKAAFYDRRALMRLETVSNYLHATVYGEAGIVLDDAWCTREALDAAAAEIDKQIGDDIELWQKHSDGPDAAEYLAEARNRRARLQRIMAQVQS